MAVFRSVTYIPHTRKQGPLRISHCLSCYQEGADAVLKKCFFLEVILEIGYT